jgi:asparagine synthase (glutamine-hydrolysing)
MCGITGYINPDGVSASDIKKMNDTLIHRGPDDDGIFVDKTVGLGQRRLSIIDLSNGHQPMCNEDGSIWITFNGEIYNFEDVKKILKKDHIFKTRSDTEVILHLYEEKGEECLTELRGMFAFAIYDSKKKKLF